MMMMMMPMSFWNGYELTAVLFFDFASSTKGQYAGWLVVIFLICLLVSFLDWLRNSYQHKTLRNILLSKLKQSCCDLYDGD
jgi:hypothetical protein